MAWTQSDLDALDAAIKTGTRSVAYDGKSVTYHSLAEMLQLREAMKSEVQGSSATSRTSYAQFDRS